MRVTVVAKAAALCGRGHKARCESRQERGGRRPGDLGSVAKVLIAPAGVLQQVWTHHIIRYQLLDTARV
jgi:hypothetical protein